MDSCVAFNDTNDGCEKPLAHFLGDFDFDHDCLQRVTTLDRMFALVVLH